MPPFCGGIVVFSALFAERVMGYILNQRLAAERHVFRVVT
ncbi:hypothetical protein JCM19237_6186 [Photobacterium aphoticum]|uniref:Uncharacterized protein n=1 Tax=Photobacterium aphoticum TaxID=754436 RepID=A0A090QM22_9GAMM|nr:hypothetical protein JCM19237_6186 [Photobacterium aphoticum]